MPVAPPGSGLPVRPGTPPRLPLGRLADAVPGLAVAAADRSTVVTGCTLDSRQVQPGDLYAALPGARAHGAQFAAEAAAAGAAAVLTDAQGQERVRAAGLPVVLAADPRAVLGAAAAEVHGHPGRAMTVLGVTGTNGKTTTAFLLDAGLRAAGHRAGLLGTVLTRVGEDVVPSVRTTPEAPDLQGLLAVMRERGVDAVSLEVSSHALALGRVDGLVVDVAVFTNLSQDHLDFHPDMAAYEAAKARLFTPAHARRGVVNAGDPAGRRLAGRALVPTDTYGDGGRWQAREVDLRPDGSSFRLVGAAPDGGPVDARATVRLPGMFNVTNALGALAALVTAGVPVGAAVEGVGGLEGVPGRMERVDAGQGFLAVVDYAHTPDAVRTLLHAVRAVTAGRVVVVLGCGGDRDRGKRPLMGRAAVEGADVAILTSDNPRSEDPLDILRQMAVPGAVVEPDRRAAIAHAVALARPGDAVVVAGKGHEGVLDVGGVLTPFDDREVLRELLGQVPA